MTHRPSRSDLAGRLIWFAHHRPVTVGAIIIALTLIPIWLFLPETRP